MAITLGVATVVLAWQPPVYAQAPCTVTVTSLPVTLSQRNAVYCLDRDLTNVTGGIYVATDYVTFDGQGHSIAFVPDASGNMPNALNITHHDYAAIKNFSFTGTGRVIAKTIQFEDAHHNLVDNISGTLTNGSNAAGDSLTFMVFFESYGNTIRNSTFLVQYASGSAGRVLYLRNDSSYNTFENNTFVSMDNGSSYALEIGIGSWGGPKQNTFRGNRIYVNNGTAILLQKNGGHNLYERNLIYSAGGGGMAVGADPGTIQELYNNTIVTPNGKAYLSQTNSVTPTHIFKNNIFLGGPSLILDLHIAVFTTDYNDIYHAATSNLLWYDTSSYPNLTAWQATNRDTRSVSANPSFVSNSVNLSAYPPTLGDFHLNTSGNSSLLGAGENGVDMGAFPRNRTCTENWVCGSYGACEFEALWAQSWYQAQYHTAQREAYQAQYRVCHDTNYCGTTNSRPSLSKLCSGLDTVAPAAVNNLSVG